ncbi:putative ankyrin repeat protein [Fusarium bulbicola]|nr:putative ankyrin repeat protein [Fusarium bulbicola]
MADPLSMAASIAGIIALADLVFKTVFSYTYKAKEAKRDVESLKEEISGLSNALRILDALAYELEAENGPRDVALNAKLLDQCRENLNAINQKVQKAVKDFDDARKWKAVSRQLKWPFSSLETKDLLESLSRYKATALLSQQVAHNTKIEELVLKVYQKSEITASILIDREKQRILDFFMKPNLNPQPSLDQSIKWRHPITGNWLLSSPELQSWFANKGSLVWLNGIAGGGKTILAGLVIQEALSRSSPEVGVAFFFCDYKNTESLIPTKILGAIASQLALQNDESFEHLEEYFRKLCPSRALEQRIQSSRLCLRKYETRDAIQHELIDRAHGMFRWVSCQLDYLCEFATDHDRLQALKELPPTFSDSYRRILERLNTRPAKIREMVQLCLHFIAFFPIPLTVLELCQAISTPDEIGAQHSEDNTYIEDDIILHCSSLIRKSADGRGFEFSHFTVREFLETEIAGLEQYRISRPKIQEEKKVSDVSLVPSEAAARISLHRQLKPLHLASALDMPEICCRLIEQGADPKAMCPTNTTLLLAEYSILRLIEVGDDRLRVDSGVFPLILSSPERRNSTIKCLIDSGASLRDLLNHPRVFSNTIRISCYLQDFSPVVALLSNGITPTPVDIEDFGSFLNTWWSCCESRSAFESSFWHLHTYFRDTSAFDTEWGFDFGKMIWTKAVAMELSFTSEPNLTDTRILLSLGFKIPIGA